MSEHVSIANRDLLAGDAEQLRREHEWDEHLRAKEERAFDFKPDPKPAPRAKRSTAPRPDRLWRERILERDQGCCVHANPAECREGWQAHHVVAQQELRKTRPEALWDIRSGMGVCSLAHRQHHARSHPILLDAIPLVVVEYLCELGFGPYLERRYL